MNIRHLSCDIKKPEDVTVRFQSKISKYRCKLQNAYQRYKGSRSSSNQYLDRLIYIIT